MGRPERWLLAIVLLTSRHAGAAPPRAEPFPSCHLTTLMESELSGSAEVPNPTPSAPPARHATRPSSSSRWPELAFVFGSLSLLFGLSSLWRARLRRARERAE